MINVKQRIFEICCTPDVDLDKLDQETAENITKKVQDLVDLVVDLEKERDSLLKLYDSQYEQNLLLRKSSIGELTYKSLKTDSAVLYDIIDILAKNDYIPS